MTGRFATRICSSSSSSSSPSSSSSSPPHKECGDPARAKGWKSLDDLTILTKGSGNTLFHPEYVNFPNGNPYSGHKVKQADVTLLPFPLGFDGIAVHPSMTDDAIRNDLNTYVKYIKTIPWTETLL